MSRPLTAGIAFAALWPLTTLVVQWPDYRNPGVAAAILVVAVAVPLGLCRLGPRGIGPVVSLLAGTSSVLLTVLLGLQLEGPGSGAQHWMNSWGVAVALVLAFAPPAEEPIAVMAGVVVACYVDSPIAAGDIQALHIAPMSVGAAFAPTICAVALAATLRTGVRAARQTREGAERNEEHLAVGNAVHRERRRRFARWEAAVVPVLEAVADGRLEPDDPEVGARCGRLAERLRAELSATPESLFEALLDAEVAELESRGGRLTVQDLDIGYHLLEADRVLLVGLVREVCAHGLPGTVVLTLVDDGSDEIARAVLAVDGMPLPDGPQWPGATLTVESPTRWWWDANVRCPRQARGR